MTRTRDSNDEAHGGGTTFAVLGSAASSRFMQAPASNETMLQFQQMMAISGESLFCSTRAGGCGDRLHVVNGTKRRPHFRHFAGTACELRDRALAADRYTHRIIQDSLVTWLQRQGTQAAIEERLDTRSRVDVYCQPGGAVIEVQLSAESASSMLQRTQRYGGNVIWLFGTNASISSRDHLLARDGFVLVVRLRPAATITAPFNSMLFRNPFPVEVGILHTAFGDWANPVIWHPLEKCEFDPRTATLRPPGLNQIIALVKHSRSTEVVPDQATRLGRPPTDSPERGRRTHRETTIKAAAADISRHDTYQQRRDASDEALSAAQERAAILRARVTLDSHNGPRPTVVAEEGIRTWAARHHKAPPPATSPWRNTLAHNAADYIARCGQISAAWAVGLPEYLVDPAWGALYHTMVVSSAPLHRLADLQTDPEGIIIHRFISLGLIAVRNCSDTDRYRAAHNLRHVGTPSPWHHPPPWSATIPDVWLADPEQSMERTPATSR